MSASIEELEDSLFEDASFEEKVTRFALDAGCQVVYITKETFGDVDEDGKLYMTIRADDRQLNSRHYLSPPSSPYTPSLAFDSIDSSTHQDVTNTRLSPTLGRPTSFRLIVFIFICACLGSG